MRSYILGVTVGFFGACSGESEAPCRVAADCASGVCNSDGTCAAVADTRDGVGDGDDAPDASDTADGNDADSATPVDTTSPSDSDTRPDTDVSGVCAPNGDGTIERAEVPIAPGLQATFAIATDVAFDTRGTVGATPRWDMSAFAGDTKVLVETLDPAPMWFGVDYPSATYATKLAADSELIGVFEAKPDGLYLLGVVSPEDGFTRTQLTYDPPARLLAYPMTKGKTWTSTSSVSGVTSGIATFATETYEGSIDADGTLKTPFADFATLRAIVSLERWVGVALYTEVSHLWVTECFGTVATVRSKGYATGPELSEAAELRRLSP